MTATDVEERQSLRACRQFMQRRGSQACAHEQPFLEGKGIEYVENRCHPRHPEQRFYIRMSA